MAPANPSNLFSASSAATPTEPVSVSWENFERFVGQFTHDVRNGLNALELQLTFLGEISTDPEAVEEVKHLRGTLGDITRQLQAIKIATGPIHPNALEYPAADLFEDLRERLGRYHPDQAKKITWDLSEDPSVSLMVDPDLTINGLMELFINADRFGSSSIHCTTTNGAEAVMFALQEIPAAPPTVPLQQWGRTPLLTTRRGAYGLGLFRTQRIMASQGATMHTTYAADKNLLTTTVILPRTTTALPR